MLALVYYFLGITLFMKRIFSLAFIALMTALLLIMFTVTLASAHEHRMVGKYTFVVGFLNEPAYAGQQNSVDLTICDGKTCNYTVKDGQRVVSNPVMDADKVLKAEVSMGGSAPLDLPLSPRYNNPGKYASYFLPSKVGTYTFHFSGTLNSTKIDEKFTSSPNTFSDAEQIKWYPDTVAQGQTTTAAPDTTTLQNQVKEARDSASRTTTFAIVGIVAGILGIAAAVYTLTRRPGTPAIAPASAKSANELRG